MPPGLIARVNAETNRWLETPAIRTRMAEGAHVAMPGPPEAMAEFWAEDRQRWTALVAETGVRMD